MNEKTENNGLSSGIIRELGDLPDEAVVSEQALAKLFDRHRANIKRSATDYRCSVVLVTHPVKAVSFPDVTQLAGGAAYQRFAQTILWLESHPEKTNQVKTDCGTTEIEHNRTLHLLKARNGRGQGVRLAFSFRSESLTLREEGIIVKKSKGASDA